MPGTWAGSQMQEKFTAQNDSESGVRKGMKTWWGVRGGGVPRDRQWNEMVTTRWETDRPPGS